MNNAYQSKDVRAHQRVERGLDNLAADEAVVEHAAIHGPE